MLALLQFDAPSLPLIERMLAEGRLPTLADLRQRGGWETIDAKATVLQSATYPTLCTGIDVMKHGLYSAYPWSPADQRVRFSHTFPKPRTIWERVTERGCRSLIVDPYLAWRPRAMAGIYLSGWHFADRMVTQARSVPRAARRDLSRRHGRPPRLDDVYGKPDAASLLSLRRHLVAAPKRAAEAVIDLLARDSFELLWLNFSAAHKAGHHLFDPASVLDEPLDGEAARSLARGLEDVYEAVDAAMGRVLGVLPDGSDVIVFSPTGMGPNRSRADLLPAMLSAVLAGEGRVDDGRRAFRTPIWSLRSSVPVKWRSRIARALPDRVVADLTTRLHVRADWKKTRAMAVPGEDKGYVRLNLRGRERYGIVEPAEAEELLNSIAEGLLTFSDGEGSPSILKVERMAELAAGASYAARLPDLVISWGASPVAGVRGVTSPRFGAIERRGIGTGRSGHHTDDAWAILLPGASRVRELGRPIRITDIGATACSLVGADLTGLSGAPLLEAA